MSLPTLVHTWQFNPNQAIAPQGSALATGRALMRAIVNSMVGFASTPWTVRGSSDSAVGAMDNVNRWLADSNLVWAGGAHSWIVLRQTGIHATFEICIDLNSGSVNALTVVVATSGFTGGSSTARPTATNEVVHITGQGWFQGTDIAYKLHAMQASDGSSTRIAVCSSSTLLSTFMQFDLPIDPVVGWTAPYVVTVRGGVSHAIALSTHNSSAAAHGYRTVAMPLLFTAEAALGSILALTGSIGNVANEINSEWQLYPMGLACTTTGNRGRHGHLADIWWKPEGLGHGDTFPAGGTRTFVCFGGIILPWNGSVPALV